MAREIGTYVILCPKCDSRINVIGPGYVCTHCGQCITEETINAALIAREQKRRAIKHKRYLDKKKGNEK